MIADVGFAVEDKFPGTPVLQHLDIYNKLLLEERRDLLHGAKFSYIDSSSARACQVSRIMIALFNRIPTSDTTHNQVLHDSRLRLNYFQVRKEKDPLLEYFLLKLFEFFSLPNDVQE